VVLEALACGTPVLATNCPGGTAEIVKETVNGWLVKTEDVGSLVNGIEQAVAQRDRYSAEQARESVLVYSSEVIAKKYLEVFKLFM
jgi:glycosyltransferase involved in cell wall biosynthesis